MAGSLGPTYHPHPMPLTDRDQAILDFEASWWKHPGAKESAIMVEFGMSPTRYYQVLHALLDDSDAWAYSPLVVKRLLRLREVRRRARSSARVGGS